LEGERRIKASGSAIAVKTNCSMRKAIVKAQEGSMHTHVKRFMAVLSASATFVLVQSSRQTMLGASNKVQVLRPIHRQHRAGFLVILLQE